MQTQSVKRARKSRALSPAMRAALPEALKGKKAIRTLPYVSPDPLAYGLQVVGDCLAPEVRDGDVAICSPSTNVAVGMIVAISFKDARQGAIKRLTYLPRPPHPDDEVTMMIRVEMNNPPKPLFLPQDVVDKMHAVTGVVRNGEFIAIETRRAS